MEHKFSLGSFHWENETTFSEFRLFRKISSGTNQKAMLHLHPNRNFQNFLRGCLENFKCSISLSVLVEMIVTCIIMWFLLLYKSFSFENLFFWQVLLTLAHHRIVKLLIFNMLLHSWHTLILPLMTAVLFITLTVVGVLFVHQ